MFKVYLPAFYAACGVTPPVLENNADEDGTVEIKDGTDLANLCRRSGVSPGASVNLTFPDVCFLPPPPAGPVPIPYPNATLNSYNNELGKSGFKKVKIRDAAPSSHSSHFKSSTGDEAGTAKGIVSSKSKGKTEFVNFSFDVKFEGKNVTPMATQSFR